MGGASDPNESVTLLLLLFPTLITLFSNSQFDTTTTRKGDSRLAVSANDLNVSDTGGKGAVENITNVHDVVSSNVLLSAEDGTNTTLVTTPGAHDKTSSLEGDGVDNFVLLQIKFDGIIDFDDWVRVTNGATIVSDKEWNTLGPQLNTFNLAEFVGGFFGADSVDGKSTLDVVHDAEVFTRFLDGNYIHEASWELGVCPDFVVDLN